MAITFHERQREAIEHVEGPMLVVAGAGTGKTAVLVERVARLIEAGHARPEEVLAVTYTVEAAAELRQRVEERVGPESAQSLRAGTIHSFAYDLICTAGRGFGTLDEKDLSVYLRCRLRQLPLERFRKAAQPAKFLEDLLNFFRRCQDELVDPADYERYVERVKRGELPLPRVSKSKDDELPREEVLVRCREIARVYRAVEEMLRQDNLGTFGHQITGAVRLLREDKALLERERQRIRFLLVDEFQDTNLAQIELVTLLAGEPRNLFAVGDPDQAIFRFRGATSAAFDEFLRRFPEARTVRLEINYRSTSKILQCAHALIQKNPPVTRPGSGLGKEFERQALWSAREEEAARAGRPLTAAAVEVVLAENPAAEAQEVARTIRERHDLLECPWSDFAILYRQHNHRRLLVEELEKAPRVPYSVGGLDVLETGPVRDLLACLRVVDSATDNVSLLRLAAQPQFAVDGIQLRNLLAKEKDPAGFRKALARFAGGKRLLKAREEAARAAAAPLMTLSSLIPPLAETFGLSLDSPPVDAFRKFVETWEAKPLPGEKTLRAFLEYLEYFVEAGGTVPAGGEAVKEAVRLMTIHTAKGLEFRQVFVVRSDWRGQAGYHENLFELPKELRSSATDEDPKEVHGQEELRLFYVAMTRARDSLTLSTGCLGGKKDPFPPRFPRQLAAEKSVQSCWQSRTAPPYTADLEAAGADSPVAAWMQMEPRWAPGELKLSATGVEGYERCPLQFKIQRDWNLPEEPSAAMQYGAAMHTVLKLCYDAARAGQPLTPRQLAEAFRQEFAKAVIEDSYQRTLYEHQGLQQLEAFLAARDGEPPPEVLDTERTFTVEIGGAKVRGRVDRLDRAGDGVTIVDYKTGRPKDQDDADDSLQLSIYAIAAQRQWKLEPRRLVFYNLETSQAVETSRTQKELDEAEKLVRIAAENIADGKFEAKPGWHCRWCSYRSLCPETEERLFTIQRALEPTGAN